MLGITNLFKNAIISIILFAIASFIWVSIISDVDISASYSEVWDRISNDTDFLFKIVITNEGSVDLTDIDFQIFDSNGSCNFQVYQPQNSFQLARNCQIIFPLNETASNYIDVFCERFNTFGSIEIYWNNPFQPSDICEFDVKYQSNLLPFPFFKSGNMYEKELTPICGDNFCLKSEIENCCGDCGCGFDKVCHINRCEEKKLTITSFYTLNESFQVGTNASINFTIESNYEVNYNFTIYWRHISEENFRYGWEDVSVAKPGYRYNWHAYYPLPNKTGIWQSLLIVSWNEKDEMKTINFTVN